MGQAQTSLEVAPAAAAIPPSPPSNPDPATSTWEQERYHRQLRKRLERLERKSVSNNTQRELGNVPPPPQSSTAEIPVDVSKSASDAETDEDDDNEDEEEDGSSDDAVEGSSVPAVFDAAPAAIVTLKEQPLKNGEGDVKQKPYMLQNPRNPPSKPFLLPDTGPTSSHHIGLRSFSPAFHHQRTTVNPSLRVDQTTSAAAAEAADIPTSTDRPTMSNGSRQPLPWDDPNVVQVEYRTIFTPPQRGSGGKQGVDPGSPTAEDKAVQAAYEAKQAARLSPSKQGVDPGSSTAEAKALHAAYDAKPAANLSPTKPHIPSAKPAAVANTPPAGPAGTRPSTFIAPFEFAAFPTRPGAEGVPLPQSSGVPVYTPPPFTTSEKQAMPPPRIPPSTGPVAPSTLRRSPVVDFKKHINNGNGAGPSSTTSQTGYGTPIPGSTPLPWPMFNFQFEFTHTQSPMPGRIGKPGNTGGAATTAETGKGKIGQHPASSRPSQFTFTPPPPMTGPYTTSADTPLGKPPKVNLFPVTLATSTPTSAPTQQPPQPFYLPTFPTLSKPASTSRESQPPLHAPASTAFASVFPPSVIPTSIPPPPTLANPMSVPHMTYQPMFPPSTIPATPHHRPIKILPKKKLRHGVSLSPRKPRNVSASRDILGRETLHLAGMDIPKAQFEAWVTGHGDQVPELDTDPGKEREVCDAYLAMYGTDGPVDSASATQQEPANQAFGIPPMDTGLSFTDMCAMNPAPSAARVFFNKNKKRALPGTAATFDEGSTADQSPMSFLGTNLQNSENTAFVTSDGGIKPTPGAFSQWHATSASTNQQPYFTLPSTTALGLGGMSYSTDFNNSGNNNGFGLSRPLLSTTPTGLFPPWDPHNPTNLPTHNFTIPPPLPLLIPDLRETSDTGRTWPTLADSLGADWLVLDFHVDGKQGKGDSRLRKRARGVLRKGLVSVCQPKVVSSAPPTTFNTTTTPNFGHFPPYPPTQFGQYPNLMNTGGLGYLNNPSSYPYPNPYTYQPNPNPNPPRPMHTAGRAPASRMGGGGVGATGGMAAAPPSLAFGDVPYLFGGAGGVTRVTGLSGNFDNINNSNGGKGKNGVGVKEGAEVKKAVNGDAAGEKSKSGAVLSGTTAAKPVTNGAAALQQQQQLPPTYPPTTTQQPAGKVNNKKKNKKNKKKKNDGGDGEAGNGAPVVPPVPANGTAAAPPAPAPAPAPPPAPTTIAVKLPARRGGGVKTLDVKDQAKSTTPVGPKQNAKESKEAKSGKGGKEVAKETTQTHTFTLPLFGPRYRRARYVKDLRERHDRVRRNIAAAHPAETQNAPPNPASSTTPSPTKSKGQRKPSPAGGASSSSLPFSLALADANGGAANADWVCFFCEFEQVWEGRFWGGKPGKARKRRVKRDGEKEGEGDQGRAAQ
ncbi:uncharacterized protein EV422DRAFT_571120 [Fimicolochytrium jonesii]|uniref:uncharacterized protein n=1 Tax=Fimicolochytrium jonesii TaxID=1396493 RepID=UPI0022FEEEEE|nr:uncharacterized protein EV422DRAFT_571120 [Fimicolochytrium jonesii]KAI8817031.1 hypothetical protein EV422DRAFT_571120 [Fimicolochytrium jonesii]